MLIKETMECSPSFASLKKTTLYLELGWDDVMYVKLHLKCLAYSETVGAI